MILADPAGAFRSDPDARGAAGVDLTGGEPAVDVGLDARARLEGVVEHVDPADPIQAVRAGLVLIEVPAVDVPALLAVHELVRLERPLGELVLVLLVVLDL